MQATDTIEINATPAQTWQVLSDLHRLPEWYVPAQSIEVITEGAVREGWEFVLKVKTLPGIVLNAVGTVKEFDPDNHAITWSGQATGISGDSRWQLRANTDGTTRIDHTFEGQGWLMFLSDKSGRNAITVHKRLTNLKQLVEKNV